MIPFNKHTITQLEKDLVMQSLDSDKICGDGIFTKKVNELINQKFGIKNFLLTTSCSSALDLSAIILDLKSGDEVIMPSFTFDILIFYKKLHINFSISSDPFECKNKPSLFYTRKMKYNKKTKAKNHIIGCTVLPFPVNQ